VKKLFVILFIAIGFCAQAQTDSTKAPYQRFPFIPPFQLLKLDSTTWLTKEDLRKDQPLLLMFFSPDCDHCQHQMEDMLKEMDAFKNVQIVMATAQPFSMMKAFYEKYQLARYPNIYIGHDTKYILPPFFHMRQLPHLSLYNSKGDLITTYTGNVKPAELIKTLK
jgi:thioredoxin-related protein